MEAVVDTNVFIYALAEDSRLHDAARALLFSFERWYVPTVVIYELVWFFKRVGVGAQEARRCVEAILGNPRTVVVSDDGRHARRALSIIVREGASLARFNDLVILCAAVDTCGVLATYDKRLGRMAKSYGVRVLPEL